MLNATVNDSKQNRTSTVNNPKDYKEDTMAAWIVKLLSAGIFFTVLYTVPLPTIGIIVFLAIIGACSQS